MKPKPFFLIFSLFLFLVPVSAMDLLHRDMDTIHIDCSATLPVQRVLSLDGRWRSTVSGVWEADTGFPIADPAQWPIPIERLLFGEKEMDRSTGESANGPEEGQWTLVRPPAVRARLGTVFSATGESSCEWESPGGVSRALVWISARPKALEATVEVFVNDTRVRTIPVSEKIPILHILEMETASGRHTLQFRNPHGTDPEYGATIEEVLIAPPSLIRYRTKPTETGPPEKGILHCSEWSGTSLEILPPYPFPGSRDLRLQYAGIGKELRPSVLLAPGGTLTIGEIRLEPGDQLAFSLGRKSGSFQDCRLSVEFENAGKTRSLMEIPLSDLAFRWIDSFWEAEIPSGESGILRFTIQREPSETRSVALLAIANPRIVRNQRTDRPNVLFISIDALRADRLGCHGNERDTSPTIDRMAAQGVRFASASSQCSWTLPSHMSMLTGFYPSALGILSHKASLSPSVTTLADRLRESGMRTAAFVDCANLSPSYGFNRGFDHFDYAEGGIYNLRSRAARWIESGTGAWFVFFHCFDVHAPYTPPKRHRERFVESLEGVSEEIWEAVSVDFLNKRDRPERREEFPLSEVDLDHIIRLYDAAIAGVDGQLGAFFTDLNRFGELNRTLIVITSDHGQAFLEHGVLGHGKDLYEEAIHVPLILRFPNYESRVRPGTVMNTPVELVTLPATILEWLKIPENPPTQGRSLWPLIQGRMLTRPLDVFSEFLDFAHSGLFMVSHRRGNWKYIEGSGPELYDLEKDPREYNNLAEAFPDRTRASRAIQKRFLEGNEALFKTAPPVEHQLDPELESRLRALGYLR